MKENKYWFKAKRYGWGWQPASKEGWFVTLLAIGYILYKAISLDGVAGEDMHPEDVKHLLAHVFGTASLLILIAWKTGEPPRWRWGDKDDK